MPSPAEQEQTLLADYQASIDKFVQSTMGDAQRTGSFERQFSDKELNDPICGTVHLRACEIVILDSPLAQRLRRIRQLGVVHYVYNGATHTRFDHSIGVLHRASSLIEATRTALLEARAGIEIDPEVEQLLRLTGLCHDLGHGLMSHVSENALEGAPEVNRLEQAFARKYQIEEPRLSEMAAFFIVQSNPFKELLDRAWDFSTLARPTRDIAAFISQCIIGAQVDEDIPLLHEIITGPLDADKLDYLKRDAYFVGIPDVVDIDRLIRKVRVAPTSWQNLPPELAQVLPKRPRNYALTGMAQSGARTLDELALARALQHDKVYRHHKVRACESMVASILTLLGDSCGSPALLPLQFHDEGFLDLKAADLNSHSGGTLDLTKAQAAEDLIKRLRTRDLFVRGYAWEHSPRPVGLASEEDQTHSLHQLKMALNRRSEKGELAAKVAERAKQIAEKLGIVDLFADLIDGRLKNYIWIDPPSTPKGRSLLSRAFLVTREGEISRFRDDYPDTEGWSDQYLVNRDTGIVFCPREIASIVYLATELVFRTEFGIRIDDSNRSVTEGIDIAAMTALKRRLAEESFYADHPTDLWPVPIILASAATAQSVEKLRESSREFSTPTSTEGTDPGLSEPAIKDYLRQFRTDDFIKDATRMLQEVKFFQRSDLVASLRRFLTEHPAFSHSQICVLGTAKDSSAVVTYYANDIAPSFGMNVCLPGELPTDASHIIFVDDFIGSGRQVVDILEGWFGLERSEDLGEDRSSTELAARSVETIRKAELGFVFCAGLEIGPSRLQTWLEANSLSGTVHVENQESSLPSLTALADSGDVATEFVAFCSEVGGELLESNGYPSEMIEDRRLGYGNKGLLVAFPYNVPAQTATLLWERGVARETEWLPLLPRRRKR